MSLNQLVHKLDTEIPQNSQNRNGEVNVGNITNLLTLNESKSKDEVAAQESSAKLATSVNSTQQNTTFDKNHSELLSRSNGIQNTGNTSNQQSRAKVLSSSSNLTSNKDSAEAFSHKNLASSASLTQDDEKPTAEILAQTVTNTGPAPKEKVIAVGQAQTNSSSHGPKQHSEEDVSTEIPRTNGLYSSMDNEGAAGASEVQTDTGLVRNETGSAAHTSLHDGKVLANSSTNLLQKDKLTAGRQGKVSQKNKSQKRKKSTSVNGVDREGEEEDPCDEESDKGPAKLESAPPKKISAQVTVTLNSVTSVEGRSANSETSDAHSGGFEVQTQKTGSKSTKMILLSEQQGVPTVFVSSTQTETAGAKFVVH